MLNTKMPNAKRIFSPAYEPRVNVGFQRVTARRPCPVCGRKKWCQVTRDGRLAHCMWESRGSVKRAKDDGYIHVLVYDNSLESTPIYYPSTLNNHHSLGSELAPLEIRDSVYSKLLELSPAWKYERELVTGERGLFARGFGADDVSRFGALPPRVAERDALALVINELLSDELTAYSVERRGATVLGVPGFWEGPGGCPRLGRASDYKRPALIIPYRDRQGMIQACQLRFCGARGKSIYTWLSTSEDNLEREPRGVSSGSPIHFALRGDKYLPDLPVVITEGALKAEAFVALRPACRAIATAGVGVAHQMIIEATRGEEVAIAFDSDHRQNAQVCRQLGKLIAEREQDAQLVGRETKTTVVVWDGEKGVDEAVLQNLSLRVISIGEWRATLEGKSLEEVKEVWADFSYHPMP
jgi:Domain of unknown function (DUF3854)